VDGIVVEGLRKRYGAVQALDGVGFRVHAGELFELLGPNGAGKSTTVKVLATLTTPDAGRAEVAGHDVVAEANAVRRAIGYVPQSSGVDRDATGRENLMLQGRIQGVGGRALEARVGELLDLLGLTDAADRVVRGYSGGMKRRLDVGLGLVHGPQVLFLDEPTTGLDPEARAAMWDELAVLAREELLTILLTTHYLEEADALTHRLAIVSRGRVVVEGTAEELKASMQGEAVVVELADGAVDGAATVLRALDEVREVSADGRWLLLYGQLFKRVTHLPGGGFGTTSYIEFLAPAIVIMNAFFGATWSGMAMVSDLDRDVIPRFLATPVSRVSLVVSQIVRSALTALIQAIVIMVVALALGVTVHAGVLGWIVVLLATMLMNSAFAGSSQGLALLTRKEATMIAIANFIGLPLFFLSSTLISFRQMPHWMQELGKFNPVNWGVVAAREVVLPGADWNAVGVHLALLAGLTV